MLTVWGRRNSFNVQKVMWLVGELGLAHRHIDAGGSFGGLDTPEFRRMNPHGKVPVLDDDGVIVWESHAILRYLAARYAPDALWFREPAARTPIDAWMDWAQTRLQPDFLNGVFWGFYRTPEAQRDEAAVARSIARTAEHFISLDRQLEGRDYLLGSRFTLADVPAGTHLYRYFNIDIERPRLPHVETWYRRLQARDAYREHVMLPFGDLYGRLDY